jgi:hypothetical protein
VRHLSERRIVWWQGPNRMVHRSWSEAVEIGAHHPPRRRLERVGVDFLLERRNHDHTQDLTVGEACCIMYGV